MRSNLLDQKECKALRGIAIFLIVLHNYCHFLKFAVKENEYTFGPWKPHQFMDKLLSLDSNLFVHIMSFLGHYGVPIFLFASGYGLVCKYEDASSKRVGNISFILSHYKKLLSLMFLGFIGFIVVSYLHTQGYHGYTFSRIVAQLLMYINVLPNPSAIIKPGPYWFFGLMLQLYIIYRLFLYKRSSYFVIAFILVCWLLQMLAFPGGDLPQETLNRLRYNFIGSMLPFGFGILYARYGIHLGNASYIGIVIVSLAVVLFGSLAFWSWLWVPLFIVTGAVATIKLLPKKLLPPLVWAGGISAALFVVHPIAREIVIGMSHRGYVYSGIVVYLILSIALAYLLKYLLGLFSKVK